MEVNCISSKSIYFNFVYNIFSFVYRLLVDCIIAISTWEFIFSDNTVHANTNEDVALAWTTGISDFFDIFTPLLDIIYNVQGVISSNSQSTKYKYDKVSTDFQKINITIINLNDTDAGLYIVKNVQGQVYGCCLLVVTGMWYIYIFNMKTFFKLILRFFKRDPIILYKLNKVQELLL